MSSMLSKHKDKQQFIVDKMVDFRYNIRKQSHF